MRQQKAEDSHEDIGSHSLGEGHPNYTPWTGLGRERDGHGKAGGGALRNEAVTSDQV